jgi:hypothetical protein
LSNAKRVLRTRVHLHTHSPTTIRSRANVRAHLTNSHFPLTCTHTLFARSIEIIVDASVRKTEVVLTLPLTLARTFTPTRARTHTASGNRRTST